MLAILKSGYSARLRHMNRVHRVNVASVRERLAQPIVSAVYCRTNCQRANGSTKVIPPAWPAVLEQLCAFQSTQASQATAVAANTRGNGDSSDDPVSVAGILPHRLLEHHILQLFVLSQRTTIRDQAQVRKRFVSQLVPTHVARESSG